MKKARFKIGGAVMLAALGVLTAVALASNGGGSVNATGEPASSTGTREDQVRTVEQRTVTTEDGNHHRRRARSHGAGSSSSGSGTAAPSVPDSNSGPSVSSGDDNRGRGEAENEVEHGREVEVEHGQEVEQEHGREVENETADDDGAHHGRGRGGDDD
jgi:hypothetical protein